MFHNFQMYQSLRDLYRNKYKFPKKLYLFFKYLNKKNKIIKYLMLIKKGIS